MQSVLSLAIFHKPTRAFIVCAASATLATIHAQAQSEANPDNVDHAGIISGWNAQSLEQGRQIFQIACAPCHGTDGVHTINPQSRPFAVAQFQNGADPLSLFRTITGGYKNMPSQGWMTPEQRYDVIQYIRETFLKKLNPSQYTKVDQAYLASLPKFDPNRVNTAADQGAQTDYGPALESQLGTEVEDALTVRLSGDFTMSYDLHRLRLAGAWEGGFLDLSRTGHAQQRGEGQPLPGGKLLRGLQTWGWAYNGRFDYPTNDVLPRGPLPEKWMRYRGHYIDGWQTVLSYSIEGREILELPGADKSAEVPALTHVLRIGPGQSPLQLCLGRPENPTGTIEGVLAPGANVPTSTTGSAGDHLIIAGDHHAPGPLNFPFVADANLTSEKLNLGAEQFSVAVRFKTTKSGTLVANAPASGPWAHDAKALYINSAGQLVYDIGWVGAIHSKTKVNDGQWHTVVLTSNHGHAQIYIDSQAECERANFARPYVAGMVFKIGQAAPNFGGDFSGTIQRVDFYQRVIDANVGNQNSPADNPAWAWTPELPKKAESKAADDPGQFVAAGVVGQSDGLTWKVDEQHRMMLNIPASDSPRVIEVYCFAGDGESQLFAIDRYVATARNSTPADPIVLTQGGTRLWPATVDVQGNLGDQKGAYVLDTIPVPFDNPYRSWLRTSAVAFFPDGRAVVTTYTGDVWIVSGLDAGLEHVTWSRFAAGLYEPFGAQVIDGTIYVTCRNGIVRLHDLNRNGQADFYETFYADTDVSTFFHGFNFDLQVDGDGNFYYTKPGEYTDYKQPGSVVKISPDGQTASVYCTGFRVPNGMAMLPDGRMTVGDNQGNWMPASKISLVHPGGFYGYVQTLQGGGAFGDHWAPDGGRIDPKSVQPPKTFDQPMIWMPQEFDSSSGGQVWAGNPRFGPLSGRLLHTSFGKGWMYYVMMHDVGDVSQAAIVKLPFQFDAGIMRARVNPADGQVYATGLSGWQGPPDGKDGCLQRVRYTGRPIKLLDDVQVKPDGIELKFNFALGKDSALDASSYHLEQWNYLWRSNYGSDQYSLEHPGEKGHDKLKISDVRLAPDGRSVLLKIPGLRPVNQVEIQLNLGAADGDWFKDLAYLTINAVPTK